MSTREETTSASCKVCILFFVTFLFTAALDCDLYLEPVWQADVGSSPVVSSPLLADLNGDNVKDVLVTSFNGQLTVVDGRSGHYLPGWPVFLSGKMLFSAPLLVSEPMTSNMVF